MIGPITVQQALAPVTVQQLLNQPVTIQQVFNPINIQGNVNMTTTFVPFSFDANQGQTTFGPLPAIPLAIWLFITGAGQNQEAGDFTISGANIILSQGVNSTDTVYGVIQIS